MDILGQIEGIGSFVLVWGGAFLLGLLVIGVLGGIAFYYVKKKRWNLRIEVKMPRSDGLMINSEKARGNLNIKEGIVFIKRKGIAAVEMKPFDIKKYLQGENYLEVLQIGANDFIPILPKSYTTIYNKNAKKNEIKHFALLEIEGDFGERKQWSFNAMRNAQNRFTLKGLLDKYQFAIQMAIIIFAIFIGFAALWSKVN